MPNGENGASYRYEAALRARSNRELLYAEGEIGRVRAASRIMNAIMREYSLIRVESQTDNVTKRYSWVSQIVTLVRLGSAY